MVDDDILRKNRFDRNEPGFRGGYAVNKRISVIGGGLGGLTTACYLAQQGHSVALYEKNDGLGGRARVWEHEGFSFDLGPSWYLMPEVFEQFFTDLGRKREDYYALRRLDPYYRVFFSDTESVDITPDLDRTRQVFESFEKGGAAALDRYLDQAEYKYRIAMDEFLYREYRSLRDFMNRRLMIEGTKIGVFRKLDSFVGSYFKDHRSKKLLEYAMVFLGTSPTNAPALYSIMSHVDLKLGVWFPEGGMISLVRGVTKLAEELGVEIHTSAPVERINAVNGVATGITVGGGQIPSDVVVVNADYAHAELTLLDETHRTYHRKYWDKRVLAPSFFVVYLGLNKKLRSVVHHNLYFDRNWFEHFDCIFKVPSWPENPSYYVSVASYDDPAVAPDGKENVFFLVPVAAGLDDNDEFRERYAEKIIEHFESITGESFRDAIEIRRLYSQKDFAADYNAFEGTALGLAHTFFQTAVFRPSHRSRKVRNLLYSGQYTHPGVGVPMTFISSRVLSDVIAREYS